MKFQDQGSLIFSSYLGWPTLTFRRPQICTMEDLMDLKMFFCINEKDILKCVILINIFSIWWIITLNLHWNCNRKIYNYRINFLSVKLHLARKKWKKCKQFYNRFSIIMIHLNSESRSIMKVTFILIFFSIGTQWLPPHN